MATLSTRTADNCMHLTVKQLLDAWDKPRYQRRLIVNNSLVYTVKLCGMLVSIDQKEDYTDYVLYDGTGTMKGRAWPYCTSGRTVLSGSTLMAYYTFTGAIMEVDGSMWLNTKNAVKVENHNEITHHFLSTIHQHVYLTKTKPPPPVYKESPTDSVDLDKEMIVTLLASESIRGSTSGARFEYLMHELQMPPNALRKLLDDLLNEGLIYATVDNNHYKLAIDQ